MFEDEVARSIWLLVAAQHLVGEDLASWSFMLARYVKQDKPNSPQRLHTLIQRTNSMMSGRDGQYVIAREYFDEKPFIDTLCRAVVGGEHVTFMVEVPATPSR